MRANLEEKYLLGIALKCFIEAIVTSFGHPRYPSLSPYWKIRVFYLFIFEFKV
jgi:hypothetical protein